MKSKLLGTAAILAFAASAPLALAQHQMTLPKDLKWDDVPSLPPGAKAAMVEGKLSEAAPFTLRLKFPANYKIAPHWHPAVERVTVISGEFKMGLGEKWDDKSMHTLPVGAVMIMQAKTPHYAMSAKPTEVQLHGTGPWGVTYINEADDPRKKAAEPKKDDAKKK